MRGTALLGLLACARVAHADPCAAAAAAHASAPTPKTTLALADCDVSNGKLGSAWALYRSLADSDPKAAAAAKRVAARAATLTLVVEPASATHVRVFANAIDARAALGADAPMPIDSGDVAIAASAPGFATWRQSVAIGEGEHKTVTVALVRTTAVAKLDPNDPDEPDAMLARDTPAIRGRRALPERGAIRVGVEAGFLFGGVGTRALVRGGYTYARVIEASVVVGGRAVGGALDDLAGSNTTKEVGAGVDVRGYLPVGELCRAYAHATIAGWTHDGAAETIGAGVACASDVQLFLGIDRDFGGYAATGIVVGLAISAHTFR